MKMILGVSAGFRLVLFCVIFLTIALVGCVKNVSAKSEEPSEKRSQKKSDYKYFYKLDGAYILSSNRLNVFHSNPDDFRIESHEDAKGWKESKSLDKIPSYYATLIKHPPDAGEVLVRYDNKKWVFDSDFSFALQFIRKSVLESFARANYPYSYKIEGVYISAQNEHISINKKDSELLIGFQQEKNVANRLDSIPRIQSSYKRRNLEIMGIGKISVFYNPSEWIFQDVIGDNLALMFKKNKR